MSTRIVTGPFITGEVVNAQTHSPMGGVIVHVSSVVFTDALMTNGVTSLLTSDLGVFTAYAEVGMYLFTTAEPLAGPIDPIDVLASSGDSSAAILQAAFTYTDVETTRAEAAEGNLLSLIAGGGGSGGTGGGGTITSGLTVVALGGGVYNLLPFGDVTILPDPNLDDVFDFTAASPVTLVPNGDDSFGVFT